MYPLAKIFFYIEILTWPPTLNSGSLSLECNSIGSINVLSSTSTGFIVIVLWYVLFHSFAKSSNLSIYTFFDTEVIYL